jgi:predicted membrane-bound spermidine synthase
MAPASFPRFILLGVFILSGVSALIYQLVWQRALLMIFGSNVESVAMVVASFLMGLGMGSLVGGWVSKQERAPLVVLFGLTELGIAAYGIVSLDVFQWVNDHIAMPGGLLTGCLAFLLVFLPTLLMGSTLPLLVAQQVRAKASVGEAVSWLYFVNTLGAAIGAWMTAAWVMAKLGLSGSIRLAALCNASAAGIILVTGGIVWFMNRSSKVASA